MSKEIVTAQGLFSKLSITLNDDTIQKLTFIPKKDNPLASIETDMKTILDKFERTYFAITHPEPETNEEDAPDQPTTKENGK